MAASGLMLSPSPLEDFKACAARHGLEPFVPADKPIQVFVVMSGADSTVVPLEVFKSDTIASIKMQIQSHRGFYVNQQRLVYGGRELSQDERLLKDYGVSDGQKLHLVLRLSDLVAITVKTVNGEKFVYHVRRSESVRDLKKHISDSEGGLPLEQQLITFRGARLEDGTVIEDLPLGGAAVLHLTVQKPTKFWPKVVGREIELEVTASESVLHPAAAVHRDDTPPKVDEASRFYQVNEVSDLRDASSLRSSPVKLVKRDDQLRQGSFAQEPARHYSSLEPASLPLRFDIPESLRDLLEQVRTGLHAGHAPKLTSEGSGGVYFLKEECGLENVGVFKPSDEEPMAVNNPRGFSSSSCGEGFKRGTRSGEGAIREVAAYILDHPASGPRRRGRKDQEGFAGVPPTMMVRCYHEAFNYSSPEDRKLYRKGKRGSLQQFVHAFSSCEDMGPSNFPVEEVHKITVLDLRLANADRNGGNILVCKGENQALKLVPIDHGYCLPEKLDDCTFEWLYWPQACKPYGPSTLEYIASLDAEQDIALLRQCGWSLRPQCARVLRVSTMLLKKGAAAGLTPFQIGSIMSRYESLDVKSPMELMLEEAEAMRQPMSSEGDFLTILSDLLDDYIAMLKPM